MPDLIPEHTKRGGKGPEVEAAFDYFDYVTGVAQTADVPLPPGVTVPAWHGWALREAFLAGCSYVRAQRASEKPPEQLTATQVMMREEQFERWANNLFDNLRAPVDVTLPVDRFRRQERLGHVEPADFARAVLCSFGVTVASPSWGSLGFEFRKLSDGAEKTVEDAAQPEKVALCFDDPPEQGYWESPYPHPSVHFYVPKQYLQKQLKIGDLITVNYEKWSFPTVYSGTVRFAIESLGFWRLQGVVQIDAVPVAPADEFCEVPKAATASMDRARQASQSESAEFSDEEIMAMMPESLHRDLADLIKQVYPFSSAGNATQVTFSRIAPLAAPGFARVTLNAGIVEHCRNVLAAERARQARESQAKQ